ncbi:hypothetical protein [Anthocerotibacter panamensis]|uniref:hypothetical protein n=1 Tax=Anthocerotibacter panamensis TaxID=2857077 RepID=UPI001C401AC5|nr:hypothetical protein [Anthocerotibacter panamensis]
MMHLHDNRFKYDRTLPRMPGEVLKASLDLELSVAVGVALLMTGSLGWILFTLVRTVLGH